MTDRHLRVLNPYDRSTVCELPYQDDSVDRIAAESSEAQERWAQCSVKERAAEIQKGLQYFRNEGESIARDITLQMGKPLAQSRNELAGFFERADHMLAIASDALAPTILPEKEGLHRRIEHIPLGVVLDLAAWNYPLLIAINVVVPALLAGNTVILKHSAKTPLSGLAFEKAFGHLAIENLVRNVVLTHAATESLIANGGVDHVSFTGSVAGGRKIYEAASRGLIDAGLELGGNDPAYVAEDADLEFATSNIVDGACYNAGQSCCAVERVYVHHTLYERFLELAGKEMAGYVLGDPLDDSTTLGPLASRDACDEIDSQVRDAVDHGAEILMGGEKIQKGPGLFYPPTLVAGVPNDAVIMQEETFGPVLPVLSVGSDDEALSKMNDTRFGLTGSIWTSNPDRAQRFGREVHAGTVFQNRSDYLDPALPWTGYGESGIGSTLSEYGFHHLTRRKSIHFRMDTGS